MLLRSRSQCQHLFDGFQHAGLSSDLVKPLEHRQSFAYAAHYRDAKPHRMGRYGFGVAIPHKNGLGVRLHRNVYGVLEMIIDDRIECEGIGHLAS